MELDKPSGSQSSLIRMTVQDVQSRRQLSLLPLQDLESCLQVLHALRGPDTHLLDDLDQPEQPQHDHQRGNLFNNTARNQVDDEARHDDEGIEAMKPRVEEPGAGGQGELALPISTTNQRITEETRWREQGKEGASYT